MMMDGYMFSSLLSGVISGSFAASKYFPALREFIHLEALQYAERTGTAARSRVRTRVHTRAHPYLEMNANCVNHYFTAIVDRNTYRDVLSE